MKAMICYLITDGTERQIARHTFEDSYSFLSVPYEKDVLSMGGKESPNTQEGEERGG